MALLTLTRVAALAISLLHLVAFQNKATGPSSVVSAAPAGVVYRRLLSNRAPLADTIDGAHILLQNDVDSATNKNSFLLLSKPRSYMNAAKACQDMSDMPYVYFPGLPASKEFEHTSKKQCCRSVRGSNFYNYWVFNAPLFPGADCMSLNRETGELEAVRCFTELPIICLNSAPRRTFYSKMSPAKSSSTQELVPSRENTAFPRSEVPGNQAIHDQILALRWVKNHIANFGGDPTMVTVFGESAGAMSIRALLSAPSAWDFYTNVIVQSDAINSPFKSPEDTTEMTTYFFEALKFDNNLIAAEFSDLVKSGQYNTKADIMWGATKDEGGRFLHDLHFLSKQIASGHSSSASSSNGPTARIHNFRFDHGRGIPFVDTPGTFCGSDDHTCHIEDIMPSFGSGTAFIPIFSQTGDDARFSRQIIDRFTSFAKTGDPNPSTDLAGVENTNTDVMGTQWLPYGNGNRFMRLDLQSRMSAVEERLEDDEVCGLFEKEVKYDFMVHNPIHPELPHSQ
ncbi:hypothetical protein KVV02_007005 [Mortierella alpina]|uniref:Carboxylic ester hydrolase n=1 Tax=Mortierella alpina TaxID=64518 RepID=A0A9P7ZY78_MORAP|nr:hypothetical protein KVV02_007005 [Mortierella alpina]